ncbi:MAG: nucleotidyltransferase domain-containing protein [Opitutales bacterium]|nr:nucleotidyltransferase domain-containing protein [Opitutales bacterium]NRA27668.1 nucleotidyltransferase domain-containing protein [Opitutales bacterium]
MCLLNQINNLTVLCREHRVRALYAFGSVLREDFDEASDVDLLVEFFPDYPKGAFAQYFDFKESLEAQLQRPVDLVCQQAIRNQVFRDEVVRTCRRLYAA